MWLVRWLTSRFIPWTHGRMFRTGVALDQPVVVTRRVFTVANGITLVRLLGLPLFVYLLVWRRDWLIAFLLVGVLACLDSIDGYVARRFNQATKLGAALDPLTDRLTVVTLVAALVVTGVLPLWLAGLVLLRDLLLLTMVGVFSRLGRPLPVSRVPVTRIGKLATMALLVGLPFLLLARVDLPGRPVLRAGALTLACVGTVLYYVALGQYVRAGLVRRPAPSVGALRGPDR
jgi:cardiolipin synthase